MSLAYYHGTLGVALTLIYFIYKYVEFFNNCFFKNIFFLVKENQEYLKIFKIISIFELGMFKID